jgi:hypothetical protein
MRMIIVSLAAGLVVALGVARTALADANPNGTGQPSQSCQSQTTTPGNASSARGSAFNTSGIAGTVYAGTQPQNSKNPASVSQYDVACFQVSH